MCPASKKPPSSSSQPMRWRRRKRRVGFWKCVSYIMKPLPASRLSGLTVARIGKMKKRTVKLVYVIITFLRAAGFLGGRGAPQRGKILHTHNVIYILRKEETLCELSIFLIYIKRA